MLKKLTIDEVTGKMSPNLRKNNDNQTKKVSKVRADNWDRYFEDIIFLKHLHLMAYIDTVKYDATGFQRNILDEVTNNDVYDDSKHFPWVGFPRHDIGNDLDESSII